MPSFVDTTVRDIDGRLRELRDELSKLEAARTALAGGRRGPGRLRGTANRTNGSQAAATRAARRSGAAPRKRTTRRGGNTRAAQTLALVNERPGITIPQIAEAMKIQPNYLYRVLPRLASDGQVKRNGQGWHPAS
ncbi:MAG: hypothetical protein JO325_15270 [Solirubrobacterales bacterium]|nr:hypothetical protein [Solirubrobacterales bacterium]